MEELLQESEQLRNIFDVNKDGKVNVKDVKELGNMIKDGDWRTLGGIILAIIIFFVKNDIIMLSDDGTPEEWTTFFVDTIFISGLVAFLNYLGTKFDKRVNVEKDKRKKSDAIIREKDNAIAKMIIDSARKELEYKLEIKTIKSGHEIEKIQIQGALNNKDEYIDMIKNGVINTEAIKTKD